MERIAIFGVGLTLDVYYSMLKENYHICGIVDNDCNKWGKVYDDMICMSPDSLRTLNIDKIIILTMWEKYIDEIKQQLCHMGLGEKCFLISDLCGKLEYEKVYSAITYTDDFHNSLHIKDGCSIKHLKVDFLGTNNKIVINRDVRTIGDVVINFRGNGGTLVIGESTSIIGVTVHVAEGGTVKIGEDCMLSHSITIMQSSCHPIYDLKTRKRINKVRDISVGDHVWIGQGVALMPGFRIGEGSIIGYGSVTSSTFGNNCTIAGNPAKVLKENVTWRRDSVGYGDFEDL